MHAPKQPLGSRVSTILLHHFHAAHRNVENVARASSLRRGRRVEEAGSMCNRSANVVVINNLRRANSLAFVARRAYKGRHLAPYVAPASIAKPLNLKYCGAEIL